MIKSFIHSYFTVDFETVWLVVKEDIPRLKPKLKKVLEDLENLENSADGKVVNFHVLLHEKATIQPLKGGFTNDVLLV